MRPFSRLGVRERRFLNDKHMRPSPELAKTHKTHTRQGLSVFGVKLDFAFDRRRGDTCACWRGMSRGLECNRDRAFALGCGGVGLVALLLAAACLVALLLVALFPATDLPPIETCLLYVYCVLVVWAWTYEYGLNPDVCRGGFHWESPTGFPP